MGTVILSSQILSHKMQVRDAVCLVTGSAQGLGKAFAVRLLAAGAKVCISDVREEGGLATLAELREKFGAEKVTFVQCDVTKPEQFRKLGVQEAELKRAVERAELAEKNLKDIEEELETVGENMKQLETSAEKALEREEKLVEKIYNLQSKYKVTEARFEYGEMNITK